MTTSREWRKEVRRLYGPLPLGWMLYDGPSGLTGEHIFVVLTGVRFPSRNKKTGDMLPVYILPAGERPGAAVRNGGDRAVCGDCRHRPWTGGGCYVNVDWAPTTIWDAAYRDTYPWLPGQQVLQGASVRFGAWGDPAAVPLHVWGFRDVVDRFTAYTHLWRDLGPEWHWCMASVDSDAEQAEAEKRGWRTFQTWAPDRPMPKQGRECLSDSHTLTCIQCGGCDGTVRGARRSSFWIRRHGFRAGKDGRQVGLFK